MSFNVYNNDSISYIIIIVTSALLPLAQLIVQEFNEAKPPSRTVALEGDFSKAFDTVNHDRLVTKINHSCLNQSLIRWVSVYLRGRFTRYAV